MKLTEIIIQKRLKLLLLIAMMTLSSVITLGSSWGAWRMCFKLHIVLFPLVGSLLGLAGIAGLFGLHMAIKLLVGVVPVTLGIPTLCAALSWRATQAVNSDSDNVRMALLLDALMHVGLPLAAITAFCLHPVGSNAFLYSFYWLIPVVAFVIRLASKKNLVMLRALSSTFIAHAMGSVMFIYSIKTSPQLWLNLIPQVAIERLCFALIASGGYILINALGKQLYKSIGLQLEQNSKQTCALIKK